MTSHPIQYQGPWFRLMAQHPTIRPHVFFCCDHGQRPTVDRDFKTKFAWSRDITAGYSHEYVPSIHPSASPYGFWHLTNPGLWTRLRKEAFDALLVVGWSHASFWIAMAAARAKHIPILMRGESGLDSWQRRSVWKQAARKIVMRPLFQSIDAFLAIGSDNADLYRAYDVPEEKVFSSPYAVDNEYFTTLADAVRPKRLELRRQLGVADDRPIVVASGKLIARKAPLDLLRAFALARRSTQAKLIYLGDGPLRGELESEVRAAGLDADVTITGFVQQEELADVYVASDLFAHPSHFESWGLVLNEAMLFGLPTICTDGASAHRDLVVEGVTGDVYPRGNIEALAKLLEQRLAAPHDLRRMGDAARDRVRDWSLARTVESVANALDYVHSRRRGAESQSETHQARQASR